MAASLSECKLSPRGAVLLDPPLAPLGRWSQYGGDLVYDHSLLLPCLRYLENDVTGKERWKKLDQIGELQRWIILSARVVE